jgi:hypothetical protein
MSALESLPKIPLSPSSPPETGLKRRRISDTPTKPPPSPRPMSVATKSYVSYGHTSHMDETASRSPPKSPVSASSYHPSTQRNSQPYSTPASSHSMLPNNPMNEDSDQHRSKRQRTDPMDLDSSILPTNHERLEKEEATTPQLDDAQITDTIPNSGLDALEKDMGEPFLLCRSSKAVLPDRSGSSCSINMLVCRSEPLEARCAVQLTNNIWPG